MQQASAGTAAALPGPLPQVIIQDGQILAGTLCKKTLGAAAGGLVHITWMEHGPEAARALLSQVRPLCRAGRAAWHSGAAPDARRGAPLHAWDVPCTTAPAGAWGGLCTCRRPFTVSTPLGPPPTRPADPVHSEPVASAARLLHRHRRPHCRPGDTRRACMLCAERRSRG